MNALQSSFTKLQIVMSMLSVKKNSQTFSYRVYYEDTDAGGVVYYANYLKFYERARSDFLRELNISQSNLANDQKIIFVVRKCQIEYHFPARLDDMLAVEVKISEINKVSLTMMQKITKSSQLISELTVELVCLNSQTFKPTRLPKNLLDLIYV